MRVAKCYSIMMHAQRIYDYISKCGLVPPFVLLDKKRLANFMFPTQSKTAWEGISTWGENVWLASNGGEIGTYWEKLDHWRNS